MMLLGAVLAVAEGYAGLTVGGRLRVPQPVCLFGSAGKSRLAKSQQTFATGVVVPNPFAKPSPEPKKAFSIPFWSQTPEKTSSKDVPLPVALLTLPAKLVYEVARPIAPSLDEVAVATRNVAAITAAVYAAVVLAGTQGMIPVATIPGGTAADSVIKATAKASEKAAQPQKAVQKAPTKAELEKAEAEKEAARKAAEKAAAAKKAADEAAALKKQEARAAASALLEAKKAELEPLLAKSKRGPKFYDQQVEIFRAQEGIEKAEEALAKLK